MNDIAITTLLIVALFLILGSGVWIGLTLSGVAWIGMQLFSSRPAGDAMAVTIWGSRVELDADRAAAVHLDGRDPVSHALERATCSAAWRRGCSACPGRLAAHQRGRLRDLRRGVGLERRHLRHHRQDERCPSWQRRGYPDDIAIGSLAGAGTLGLLIPPSIIMIVYGVTADVSIAQLFIAGVLPGILLALLFSGYLVGVGAAPIRARAAAPTRAMSFDAQAARVAPPDSGGAADRRRAGLDLQRHRHRHRGGGGRRGGLAGPVGRAGLARTGRPSRSR